MKQVLSGVFGSLIGLGFLLGAQAFADAEPSSAQVIDKCITKLVNGEHRSSKNIARNPYRHPSETLAFFGLREDMTVVEVSPGGGWYMEILAPYLRDKGRYIAAGYDPDSEVEYFAKGAKKLNEKIKQNPDLYGKTELTVMALPDKLDIAASGSADMVLTFRNVHNWMRQPNGAEKVFQAMYRALKPGGILGLVQHRADPSGEQDMSAKSGYVQEAHVIKLAQQAGFELAARSEINANPKDTRNHPEGVWTLPPTLSKHIDDKKYQAIGESDRMTLKFLKPVQTMVK